MFGRTVLTNALPIDEDRHSVDDEHAHEVTKPDSDCTHDLHTNKRRLLYVFSHAQQNRLLLHFYYLSLSLSLSSLPAHQ